MKKITVHVSEGQRVKEQGNLFGIFFEDLNHAADGGLYGEMVRNRAFEFDQVDNRSYHHMTAWDEIQRGNSLVQTHIEQWDPRTTNNPHYLVLEVLAEGEGGGIRNEGYGSGFYVESGKEYYFTSYCRMRGSMAGSFEIRLENKEGTKCYGSAVLRLETGGWRKLECVIKSDETDLSARLVILTRQVMTAEFDVISLFPVQTFKMRKYGLRNDIAEMIQEMRPRFLRFPGGCLTHIGSLDARDRNAMYRWKNTLGDVWNRPARRNSWDYNQTLGLGFYELFQFCEDIGAEPLPVISAGFDPHFLRAASLEDMQEWIDEAVDLIEFANGEIHTKWGAVRAAMGHPESFHLKFLAIGNEEVGDEYYERYEKIAGVVKAVYPDILLINSAGPCAAGSEFDKGWRQAEKTDTAFSDEHFYQCPEWFVANVHRYDNYGMRAKAFLGEYASHGMSWWNGLAEAAFMIGMEKAEGIGLACYAPLLDHVAYTNWKTTLLHYDNHSIYGTPSYYVQKLFMNYQGETLVCSESDCPVTEKLLPRLDGAARVYTGQFRAHITGMVIYNEDTGEERRVEDFRVSEICQEQRLPDIEWENYRISFCYCRETGGTLETLHGTTALRLEFAMKDEKNCIQLVMDGWERTVTLHGVVNGYTCGVGMMQVVMEQGKRYHCEITVSHNRVRVKVDGSTLEHEFQSSQPEGLYHSAVLDREGNLIVKLANLTAEEKEVSIMMEQRYQKLQIISVSNCELEWENSFEEPQKVFPKEQWLDLRDRERADRKAYDYMMRKYTLAVLKFMV